MRFLSPSIAVALRWIVVITLAFVMAGCGSRGGQTTVLPMTLPPAIAAAEPVLLYTGTGSSPTDVSATEAILDTLKIGYVAMGLNQLDALVEAQMGGYKVLIVPGGNSIPMGQNLSATATATIRAAVAQYGLHYLGICADAFLGWIFNL